MGGSQLGQHLITSSSCIALLEALTSMAAHHVHMEGARKRQYPPMLIQVLVAAVIACESDGRCPPRSCRGGALRSARAAPACSGFGQEAMKL